LLPFGNAQATKAEKPEDRPLRISPAVGFARSAQAESFIVEEGQARAQIVLGEEPGRVAKFAARRPVPCALHFRGIAATLSLKRET
jgi:hypothetical protein